MTYWSDDTSRYAGYPVPGSFDAAGAARSNAAMLGQLNAIDVLAYAFLEVDAHGSVYFRRPAVDISRRDRSRFCDKYPSSCPHTEAAQAGSFAAFARLQNVQRTLRRIISIGGAGSQRSLDNALAHPRAFIRSAAAIIRAYHLDGIDLDFEPEALFGVNQGIEYARLAADLRQELGETAFISIELPGDWETLRSIDCPADADCRDNLALLASSAYISLMGYDYHGPDYPGGITGGASNLYTDPNEPLLAGFYHVSDNQAIGYLTFRKVPPGRILLGFPAYFVAYGGVDAAHGGNGLYAPFDPAMSRPFDQGLKGLGSYRVARQLLESGFMPHRIVIDGRIGAVFAYDASTREWMSYENPQSVAAKARYVVSRHLAGMMMWEIGEDLPVSDPSSLLRSAHAALMQRQSSGEAPSYHRARSSSPPAQRPIQPGHTWLESAHRATSAPAGSRSE
jgi:chitinase